MPFRPLWVFRSLRLVWLLWGGLAVLDALVALAALAALVAQAAQIALVAEAGLVTQAALVSVSACAFRPLWLLWRFWLH